MKLPHNLIVPLGCLAALGCGGAANDTGVTVKPTPFDAAAAKARELSAATEAAATAGAAADEPATPPAQIDEPRYTPPYPDRETLFSPPRRMTFAGRSDEEGSSDSVVLIGFANLEQPRALLSIDRRVLTLAAGEESEGVKVISISKPRAVLQRGTTRWTATIE